MNPRSLQSWPTATAEERLQGMTTMTDLAGYLASTMVLLTFMTKDMRLLRVLAIFSNIAFITYGVLAWLPPVFCLHLLLFPVNVLRLRSLLGEDGLPAAGPVLITCHKVFRRNAGTNSIKAQPEHVLAETRRTYSERFNRLALDHFDGRRVRISNEALPSTQ
jgi:hypothetical protein